MFSNGEIQRGMEPQKRYPIEERNYIFCRGRINNAICAGMTTEGYSNEFNSRTIRPAINVLPLPTSSNGEGKIQFYNLVSEAIELIGTGSPVKINKRFLVVEAKISQISTGETNKKLHVKFSNSKELGDDGLLYEFTLTDDLKKYYIDLNADNITGQKYIAFVTALFANTSMYAEIKRIYFTDIEEAGIFVAYDGDATKLGWQGWTGWFGTNIPGIIDTNKMILNGDGTDPSTVKTLKRVNAAGRNFVGIKYNVTEIISSAPYHSFSVAFIENNETVGSYYEDVTATGEGIAYLRVEADGRSGSGNHPLSGSYELALNAANGIKMEITKVWLE